METSQNRLDFIDLAKAFGILLVVFRHTGNAIGIFSMLHMPLFFIISGMFYKDYNGFTNLLKNKTNKLLIPWVFFYLLGCLMFYVALIFKPEIADNYAGFADIFIKGAGFNYPIWFLLCLFWDFLFFFLIRLIKNAYLQIIIIFTIGSFGTWLGHNNVFLPCHINIALTALPFFYFGFLIKNKTNLLVSKRFDKRNIFICACCIVITIVGRKLLHPHLWLAGNQIDPVCYILSTTGVIAIILLCKFIDRIPYIQYIGTNSLIILCWHNFIQRPTEYLIGGGYKLFIITILVSVLLIPISKKIIPWFVGKKDLIK